MLAGPVDCPLWYPSFLLRLKACCPFCVLSFRLSVYSSHACLMAS